LKTKNKKKNNKTRKVGGDPFDKAADWLFGEDLKETEAAARAAEEKKQREQKEIEMSTLKKPIDNSLESIKILFPERKPKRRTTQKMRPSSDGEDGVVEYPVDRNAPRQDVTPVVKSPSDEEELNDLLKEADTTFKDETKQVSEQLSSGEDA
jgi:hypothetical protein